MSITQLALSGLAFGMGCGASVLGIMACFTSVTRTLGDV